MSPTNSRIPDFLKEFIKSFIPEQNIDEKTVWLCPELFSKFLEKVEDPNFDGRPLAAELDYLHTYNQNSAVLLRYILQKCYDNHLPQFPDSIG